MPTGDSWGALDPDRAAERAWTALGVSGPTGRRVRRSVWRTAGRAVLSAVVVALVVAVALAVALIV